MMITLKIKIKILHNLIEEIERMGTSRVKKKPILKSNYLDRSVRNLLVWLKWTIFLIFYYNIFNILLQWNWVQVLCRCIAHYLKLIKAEQYIFIYFLRRNTNVLKD